ncbi:MAG: hypothetical protein OEO19_09475 [Gammaproteobacteria bacterium]|nr:hypothetical protein [Gammaproteobacteria bacterium]MDH3446706.1 hypothetical protein [Gammaproteobacteria bacterium]
MLELRQGLYQTLGDIVDVSVVIASNASGLSMTDIQASCATPADRAGAYRGTRKGVGRRVYRHDPGPGFRDPEQKMTDGLVEIAELKRRQLQKADKRGETSA